MKQQIESYYPWILMALGALLFFPYLGSVHLFDWDEINFAQMAREMLYTGDYLNATIDFHPFWEKPPLFIWMQALSMHLFGINEFAARFPNALCGLATLLILYQTGKKLYNPTFGFIWSLAYAGSILPFFFFKSGIIDPWFNLFIFLGIHFFILYIDQIKKRKQVLILSALFIGLGIMTKGPVALLVFILVFLVFLTGRRFRIPTTWQDVVLFSVVTAVSGGFWFILQILTGNYQTVVDFMVYQIRLFSTQDAGHGGFPLYHVVVLLIGVFPASVFAIKPLFSRRQGSGQQRNYELWMKILFWVVLILFSIVKTKIVHYSSLCYYPLTFLAALHIHQLIRESKKIPTATNILLGIIGMLLVLVTTAVAFIEHYKTSLINSELIQDPFAIENLKADVSWQGTEWLPAFILLIGLTAIFAANRQRKTIPYFSLLASTMLLYTFSAMLLLTPRIEAYTQHAAITFYQKHAEKDIYIETLGYKSYADLFYGKRQPLQNPKAYHTEWLLSGKIDKPAYFVSKSTKKEYYLTSYPELRLLDEKNGYIFYIRDIPEH